MRKESCITAAHTIDNHHTQDQATLRKIKKCQICDTEFEARRATAKYCGQACKDRSTNDMRAMRKNASPRPHRNRGNAARRKQNTIAPLLRAMNHGPEIIWDSDSDGMATQKFEPHSDHQWFDDYVMGACYVSMNADRGRLDVSPGDIRKLCKLDEISVKSVQSLIWNHQILPVSKRHAQRLVKVAIIALSGIEMYLDRNPAVKAKLESLAEFESESAKIDRQFFAEWESLKDLTTKADYV
ncbi:hypothetical protein QEM15_002538 [Pseudomonas putida]|nr:hypothetical protein [Pseudomonas putida]